MVKAMVLDFDGVILESVDIKTRAFRSLFRDYPSKLGEILRIHRDMAGISRFEKFKIIYRDVLKKPLTEAETERLGREFSAFTAQEIFTCPFVPGAQEFLEEQSRRLPIFIVSGTPEEELKDIVIRRNLGKHCRGVYGSPRSKDVLLRQILAGNSWHPREIMFVGDAMTDYKAAGEIGVHFVARVADGESSPFPDSVRWVVLDLKQLADRWDAIAGHVAASSGMT